MRRKDILSTEFAFTLPRGLVDAQNRVHRQGTMRLATAKDEIYVQNQQLAKDNSAYSVLVLVLLALIYWKDLYCETLLI